LRRYTVVEGGVDFLIHMDVESGGSPLTKMYITM
jgi:hypothetical protein